MRPNAGGAGGAYDWHGERSVKHICVRYVYCTCEPRCTGNYNRLHSHFKSGGPYSLWFVLTDYRYGADYKHCLHLYG